jgi:chemotaxis signal transduction protein
MSRRVSPSHARRGEPVVIFRLGSHRFVVASAEVEEIRDLHQGSLPLAVATRGNGRQIPVVSADQIFGMPSAKLEQLLVLKTRGVAVAIGQIEGMAELCEIVALPQGFHGQERSWYRGLGLVQGRIVPVVNAAIFAESARAMPPVPAGERVKANSGT